MNQIMVASYEVSENVFLMLRTRHLMFVFLGLG
jgi:hypothetical protein